MSLLTAPPHSHPKLYSTFFFFWLGLARPPGWVLLESGSVEEKESCVNNSILTAEIHSFFFFFFNLCVFFKGGFILALSIILHVVCKPGLLFQFYWLFLPYLLHASSWRCIFRGIAVVVSWFLYWSIFFVSHLIGISNPSEPSKGQAVPLNSVRMLV